jgi:hypothetical protein
MYGPVGPGPGNLHTHGPHAHGPEALQGFSVADISHRSSTNKHSALTLMSHTHPMTASSSNFQLIVNNALKAYERRTKKDLLSHPLAVQMQTCRSPSSILAVLQEQVQGLNQSQMGDDRLTKWLDPTVNVIHAFSTTLESGVSLVRLRTYAYLRSPLSYLSGRYSHLRRWSLPESASSF